MKVPHHPHHRLARALALGLGAAALAAPTASAHHQSRTDAVSTWNENAGKAAVVACLAPDNDPLHESRLYAMTHVAIHDALNAIDRRSRPYAFAGRALPGASVDAAVAAAARDVLVPVLSEQTTPPLAGCVGPAVASVEADYAAALAEIPEGRAKRRGLAVGAAAATTIVARRTGDGADTTLFDTAFPQDTTPGVWRFTPGTDFAFAPGWADVTPFVLRDAAQFRPGPPYPLTSRRYAADFNEIKALGGLTGSARTPEQTEIAHFWVESSPLGWNRIARTVSQGADPWKQARLFGLLNLALADGYISSFDTKYHYDYWRPVTAIHEAASDGNPDTQADPSWASLWITPPVADYDSAHSVEGGAAAAVLRLVLGRDRVRFSTCSTTLPDRKCGDPSPVYRHYRSFSQAAEENRLSRIYVGFHFRKATREGNEHGRKIGERAVDRFMRPTRR